MVAHVVLFDLRPDLEGAARQRFNDALLRALAAIPSVRRFRVGRRLSIGTAYEAQPGDRFDCFSVIEFDDEAGLRAYLAHPAHVELGALFWSSTTRTLVLDYALAEGDLGRALATWV
jgi:hypothetical protein